MTPKVPDYGHREADKELFALIRRLHLSYRQARIGLMEKIEEYMEQFEKEDAMKRALYDSGELSHEEYTRWKYSTLAGTKQWKRMLNQLADDMTHQNQIAASMIDDTLPGVYALNHNYGTYEAEKGSGYDTTYTLYDKNTVKRLLTEHEDLLPHPSVPVEKDKLWNKQHLQSAVLQGILTGEPMSDIAKRFQSVTDMTERAAMRNARTAVTGAENAGRIDSYIRAQNMGIKMKQMWMATLDSRTRDSHAIMDGQIIEVGKKFSNGCSYPGDPNGAPGEIYNCRCSLVAVVEGADEYNPNLRPSEYLKEQGLTYERWKEMHGERFYSELFKDYEEPKEQLSYSVLGVKRVNRPNSKDYEDFDSYRKAYDKYKEERQVMKQEINEVVQQALNYKRFDTSDDLLQWAKEQGVVIKPDVLEKIDLRALNETSVALEELFAKFPEVKSFEYEYFDGTIKKSQFKIGVVNEDFALLTANGGLNFSIRNFSDYEEGLKQVLESYVTGFGVEGDGTFSTAVRHEFGHNVKDYIEFRIQKKYHYMVDDWTKNFSSFDDWKNAKEECSAELKRFEKDLLSLAGLQGSSEYSNTNDEELFAEGFAAYTSRQDSDFAKAFGEFLKRWY